MRPIFVCAFVACLLWMPRGASAYGVLSHEAIVDAAWERSIVPLLQERFPSSDEELRNARLADEAQRRLLEKTQQHAER